jgi:hypothetical protein
VRLASEEEAVVQPESAAPSARSDPGVLQLKVRLSMSFSPPVDDRCHSTRKRGRLRYVNVQTSVYVQTHDPRESSGDFPEVVRATRSSRSP